MVKIFSTENCFSHANHAQYRELENVPSMYDTDPLTTLVVQSLLELHEALSLVLSYIPYLPPLITNTVVMPTYTEVGNPKSNRFLQSWFPSRWTVDMETTCKTENI